MSSTLFLAVVETCLFIEGTHENVLGVFSTESLAKAVLQTDPFFGDAIPVRHGEWSNVVDGEMTVRFRIEPITVDRLRSAA